MVTVVSSSNLPPRTHKAGWRLSRIIKCVLGGNKVNPIKELIARHILNLRKINEPLEEVQRLLALGDKECGRLEQEVSHASKAENSSNCKTDFDSRQKESMRTSDFGNDVRNLSKTFQNYSGALRRPPLDRYTNTFLGYCYNCYKFGHKAIDCRTPVRRNVIRKDYPSARTMSQTKNSLSLLSHEEECFKCNNFGHTAANCRLKQFIHEESKVDDICGIALYAQKDEGKWYIDSGCTKHMTGNKEKFLTLKREKGGDVAFGDDGTTKILGK